MNWAFIISAFAAIFSVVNPISKILIFPMLTEGFSRPEQKKVITSAVLFSFVMFLTFGLLGGYLFSTLGVDYLALRLTGAVVLFKIGFDMIQGQIPKTKPSEDERDEVAEKAMVGIFPLGIPFIAGPSALITVMLYMNEAPTVIDSIAVIFVVLAVCLITFLFLIESRQVYERIGKVGVMASMRIMGMILLSIAIQMFVDSYFLLVG